ncbi:MAG TPA: hypothetical protein PKA06_09325, partial [Gemmatales bacterium]|nr:hypothetical protein [Gemmatales bacterium]
TAFYRKVLTTAGWKEKASPLETEDVASLHFQKQGYNLQLSAGWDKRKNHAVVGLRHLGNVDVRQLPYPKDCIIETTEVEAINTTTKLSIEEVMQFYREELPKLGWREQKVLGQGVIRFVQNAVTLNIEVKKHTNNQTAIQTRTSIR